MHYQLQRIVPANLAGIGGSRYEEHETSRVSDREGKTRPMHSFSLCYPKPKPDQKANPRPKPQTTTIITIRILQYTRICISFPLLMPSQFAKTNRPCDNASITKIRSHKICRLRSIQGICEMGSQDQIAVEADIVTGMADNEGTARCGIGYGFAVIWGGLLSAMVPVQIDSHKEEE